MASICRSPPDNEPARCCALAEPRQQANDVLAPFAERVWLQVATHPQVLVDRQGAEHVAALGHVTDPAPDEHVGRRGRDVVAAQADAAPADIDEAEHRLHERRLPGPVRADDPDDLAFVHVEAASVEDVDARQVPGDQIPHLEQRGLWLASCRRSVVAAEVGVDDARC